jgi:hypothetical protein
LLFLFLKRESTTLKYCVFFCRTFLGAWVS